MHLNMYCLKPSHACGDTKCIKTCIDQKQCNSSEDIKCVSTCVVQSHPMIANTQNASQHVMIVIILCQLEHEKYVNMCWQNPLQSSEHTRYISTCVDHPPPMKARTHNAYQHLLTKLILCQRRHRMHLNLFRPNTSACVDQLFRCQRRHKIHLNTKWPNPSHAC